MVDKVSLKDRAIYIICIVFLTLDLTSSNVIWASEIGYYIQIVARIIACIGFAIIVILDLVDSSRKLKNRENLYSKKQIFKIVSSVLIDFIILIIFVMTTYKRAVSK
ncbi:hypothetical protein CIW83_05160 [Tissierella sp. P1]|jgi:hypothetical protein|uniref:hypothetical protein n=1 Tax=Tissierella TaxID=41273 RepID=UPI000B9FE20A|nr:hypothetical protein [Tissierella sp. P1]MDU5080097.1 hypothetical protein [Bacillota bacterium]OZV13263.1 hypothetical protein CIW83_05160 [Tissierella sp. P1]